MTCRLSPPGTMHLRRPSLVPRPLHATHNKILESTLTCSTVVARKRAHGRYTLLCAQTRGMVDIGNIATFYHEKAPRIASSIVQCWRHWLCSGRDWTPFHRGSRAAIPRVRRLAGARHERRSQAETGVRGTWTNDYSAVLTWPDEESGEEPSSLLDTVLVPISHHFLCNYRLTLHHVAFENIPARSQLGGRFRPLQEMKQ